MFICMDVYSCRGVCVCILITEYTDFKKHIKIKKEQLSHK